MAGKFDAVTSPADVMHRLRQIENDIRSLQTSRTLESASVGRGGLRIRGGLLRVQDVFGDDMLRAGGDPGELFLRGDLLSPLAVAVLADRVTQAQVNDFQATTNTAYSDLGTIGPVVDCETLTGKIIVFVSANVTAPGSDGANMSFVVTGATELETNETGTLSLVTGGASIAGSITKIVTLEGLNPGTHQLTAKYRSGSGGLAAFGQRNLTVIAF